MTLELTGNPIEISSRAASRIHSGNLWIFSNEMKVIRPLPAPGIWCQFKTGESIVGTGYYNPHSLIAGRILTSENMSDLEGLLSRRLEEAFRRRLSLTTLGSMRLVFSEADQIPGLIVDFYSGVVVIQSNTAGMDAALPAVERLVPVLLKKIFKKEAAAIIVRGDSSIRRLENVPDFSRVIKGEEAALTAGSFSESGVTYAANFLEGQKTGFFLDQRDNRAYLDKADVQGKSVLDLFCYSGGWGLRALKKGAASATFVDESEPALELVRRGLELNQLDAASAQLIAQDVFDFLNEDTGRYDIIIADPPAFVKSQKNLGQAKNAYEKLNRLAWRRLAPGGLLMSSSCSYHLSEQDFVSLLASAVGKERGMAHVVFRGGQAKDHPILLSMPETKYLKCIGLRKL